MPLDTAFEEQFKRFFEKKSHAIANPDGLDDEGTNALHIEAHEKYVRAVKIAANAIFSESPRIEIHAIAQQVKRVFEKMDLPLEQIKDGLLGMNVVSALVEDIMRWPNLDEYDPKAIRERLDAIDLEALDGF